MIWLNFTKDCGTCHKVESFLAFWDGCGGGGGGGGACTGCGACAGGGACTGCTCTVCGACTVCGGIIMVAAVAPSPAPPASMWSCHAKATVGVLGVLDVGWQLKEYLFLI